MSICSSPSRMAFHQYSSPLFRLIWGRSAGSEESREGSPPPRPYPLPAPHLGGSDAVSSAMSAHRSAARLGLTHERRSRSPPTEPRPRRPVFQQGEKGSCPPALVAQGLRTTPRGPSQPLLKPLGWMAQPKSHQANTWGPAQGNASPGAVRPMRQWHGTGPGELGRPVCSHPGAESPGTRRMKRPCRALRGAGGSQHHSAAISRFANEGALASAPLGLTPWVGAWAAKEVRTSPAAPCHPCSPPAPTAPRPERRHPLASSPHPHRQKPPAWQGASQTHGQCRARSRRGCAGSWRALA